VLKAQIYVPTAADIPDALDVWQSLVPHPCALTASATKGFGFVEGVVEINLLALRDGAKRRKEVLKVDLPPMASYGAHVRAGELVFPSALMPAGGDERFDGLAHRAQVQALTALDWAERIAKSAGTSAANIVRAQWFMADATQFPGVQLAWQSRHGRAPHPFVCVQPPGALAAPGAALTADFWIYAP
jgi:enamine deaminase RidA (YjgF/YER057c/UK114 family)